MLSITGLCTYGGAQVAAVYDNDKRPLLVVVIIVMKHLAALLFLPLPSGCIRDISGPSSQSSCPCWCRPPFGAALGVFIGESPPPPGNSTPGILARPLSCNLAKQQGSPPQMLSVDSHDPWPRAQNNLHLSFPRGLLLPTRRRLAA